MSSDFVLCDMLSVHRAIAFGITAHMVATIGRSDDLADRVNARITDEELEMMKEFGMEDGDGYVSNNLDTIIGLQLHFNSEYVNRY